MSHHLSMPKIMAPPNSQHYMSQECHALLASLRVISRDEGTMDGKDPSFLDLYPGQMSISDPTESSGIDLLSTCISPTP